ncbi:MAG: hypothetical protein Q4F84_05315 [Fibrobacter sp.]|nr:hypothetical protein [Fibrobacter sp.]
MKLKRIKLFQYLLLLLLLPQLLHGGSGHSYLLLLDINPEFNIERILDSDLQNHDDYGVLVRSLECSDSRGLQIRHSDPCLANYSSTYVKTFGNKIFNKKQALQSKVFPQFLNTKTVVLLI